MSLEERRADAVRGTAAAAVEDGALALETGLDAGVVHITELIGRERRTQHLRHTVHDRVEHRLAGRAGHETRTAAHGRLGREHGRTAHGRTTHDGQQMAAGVLMGIRREDGELLLDGLKGELLGGRLGQRRERLARDADVGHDHLAAERAQGVLAHAELLGAEGHGHIRGEGVGVGQTRQRIAAGRHVTGHDPLGIGLDGGKERPYPIRERPMEARPEEAVHDERDVLEDEVVGIRIDRDAAALGAVAGGLREGRDLRVAERRHDLRAHPGLLHVVGGRIAVAAVVAGAGEQEHAGHVRIALPDDVREHPAGDVHLGAVGDAAGIRELFKCLHLHGCNEHSVSLLYSSQRHWIAAMFALVRSCHGISFSAASPFQSPYHRSYSVTSTGMSPSMK